MKVNTNKIGDLHSHYLDKLREKFNEVECRAILKQIFHHFLDIQPHQLHSKFDHRISESEMLLVHFAVKDLLKNKPLQYVLGEAPFLDFMLTVDENVLIPRPETEELVQLVFKNTNSHKILNILDIGTGSGCIALALKNHFTKAKTTAIDISPKALEIAKANAIKYNLNINFLQIDILEPSQWQHFENTFDLIISNPPYILPSEKSEMHPNVLEFEPESALFVPEKAPLLFYDNIAIFASKKLNPKGQLWFEINERMGDSIKNMLCQYFNEVEILPDFRNKTRFAVARK